MNGSVSIERRRLFKDRLAGRLMHGLAVLSALAVVIMAAALFVRSAPILGGKPLTQLFCSTAWYPSRGEFGFLAFIAGTIVVTAVACLLAVPVCILTAIYLSEYAARKIRESVSPFIDVLAGIPSVVYGMWGVLVIVPFIARRVAPFFGASSSGYCVLAGGMVLAVMIMPIIIHVSLEVLRNVPAELREASLALGATKWQTVKNVVLRRTRPGILAACVLGVSRAFGETIAVLMVVGNVARIPKSVFDPAYPLPALIANNYGEMMSVPFYESGLMLAAFILLMVVLFFNVVSRVILGKVKWSVYGE